MPVASSNTSFASSCTFHVAVTLVPSGPLDHRWSIVVSSAALTVTGIAFPGVGDCFTVNTPRAGSGATAARVEYEYVWIARVVCAVVWVLPDTRPAGVVMVRTRPLES
ncbi:unannotated protein [freshwater metagenome]|uniref:Unannotated protein n=1 Tax=freshwater metagenome TaxID=449393 RepID=A0A6J7LDY7_9ZZZZ